MDKLNIGAIAAAVLATALVIGVDVGDEPEVQKADTTLEVVRTDDPAWVEKYTEAITEVRKDPEIVDLGGQLVEPGATTTAGATFPLGTSLVSAELVGAPEFVLDPSAACSDRGDATWCEVSATNTSDHPARLVVLVRTKKE